MRSAPLLLAFLAGCQCLPVPPSDTTAPTASIIVEYREPGGQRVTRTVAAGGSNIMVVADRNDEVTVLYSGGDNQGMRIVELDYDMSYRTGNTVVRPLLPAIKITSNCPRSLLAGSRNFGPDSSPWRYVFSTRSENWMGTTQSSGKVTVQTQ